MKNRTLKTATEFNILDKIQKLEKELLCIDRVTEVDFDLDGFYDNIGQVIFLTKYDIPATTENYWHIRQKLLVEIVMVAKDNGLTRTEDSIEDYGTWFYFVFKHDKTWKLN